MTVSPNYDKGVWWIINHIAGTVPELLAKRTLVEARRRAREESAITDDDPRLRVPASAIEASVELDRNRIARIEDKARGTVVGITIAVSIAGAGIAMFGKDGILDSGSALTYLAATTLVLGLIYFLLSGWFALSAYAASPLHVPDVQDRPETRKASPSIGDSATGPGDDETWRRTLLDCLDLNRFLAIDKTNRFSASIELLRNGLVSVLLFAVLAVVSAVTQ
jgi:hypothetical protein